MTGLLESVLVGRVIVAIDPGKVLHRVWITTGDGLLGDPVSLPTSRAGLDRREDIAFVDDQIERLLADSAGQILTTLPGVLTIRAAAFAAHTLPVERFATPEHLYSATGLAPASYESSTVRRRGGISRTGLPEHRDALIGIAWGLGQFAPAFQQRLDELRARGKAPLQARVALARHACRLCWRILRTQQPYDDRRYDRARRDRGR